MVFPATLPRVPPMEASLVTVAEFSVVAPAFKVPDIVVFSPMAALAMVGELSVVVCTQCPVYRDISGYIEVSANRGICSDSS